VSAPKRQLIEALASSGADSLDLVELVMELEKQLGINEDSLKKMGGIRSLGELIDLVIRASPD
jgi:acyl carrier protein